MYRFSLIYQSLIEILKRRRRERTYQLNHHGVRKVLTERK